MKNQNTLAHFLNIPHPMTDNQFRDFRKSQISALKLISGLKEKRIIDREVQAQLYNLIKRQTITIRKLCPSGEACQDQDNFQYQLTWK